MSRLTCFSLVGSAHRNKGLAITIGVVGGAIAVVDGVSLASSHCRGDRGHMDSNSGLSNGDMSHMAIGLGPEATGLASHLPLDGVAHLPGDRVTSLHGNLDGDGEGDSAALGDGLGGAHSFRHLPGHGGAVSL